MGFRSKMTVLFLTAYISIGMIAVVIVWQYSLERNRWFHEKAIATARIQVAFLENRIQMGRQLAMNVASSATTKRLVQGVGRTQKSFGLDFGRPPLQVHLSLYDRYGVRRAGRDSELSTFGLGTPVVSKQEQGRFKTALKRSSNTVLVPSNSDICISYLPVISKDRVLGAIQAVIMLRERVGLIQQEGEKQQSVLRPVIREEVVSEISQKDGQDSAIVSLPVHSEDRTIGMVTVRVPEDTGLISLSRYLAILAGGIGCYLILGCIFFLSFLRSSTASVDKIEAFAKDLEDGRAGELIDIEGMGNFAPLIRSYNHRFQSLQNSITQILKAKKKQEKLFLGSLEALVETIEASDAYTKGHSVRVAQIAVKIARAIGLPFQDVGNVRIGSLLHDIGKIGIDKAILNKPGRLLDEEFKEIQKHPVYGYRIVSHLEDHEQYSAAVLSHHEKLDGSGYPNGISGDEIPLIARIVCVADAYEAMTSDRAYRKAMSVEDVQAILEAEAGKRLDADCVRVLFQEVVPSLGENMSADFKSAFGSAELTAMGE